MMATIKTLCQECGQLYEKLIHEEYPKALEDGTIVANAEEEAALAGPKDGPEVEVKPDPKPSEKA